MSFGNQYEMHFGYARANKISRNATAVLTGGTQGEQSSYQLQYGYLLGTVLLPMLGNTMPFVDFGAVSWRATLHEIQSVTAGSGTISVTDSASLKGTSPAVGTGLRFGLANNFSVQLQYLYFQTHKPPALSAHQNNMAVGLLYRF